MSRGITSGDDGACGCGLCGCPAYTDALDTVNMGAGVPVFLVHEEGLAYATYVPGDRTIAALLDDRRAARGVAAASIALKFAEELV